MGGVCGANSLLLNTRKLRHEIKEIGERNAVEGKFGNGKHKLDMVRIMAKLKETTCTMIMIDVFVLNMERLFRQGVLFSYYQYSPKHLLLRACIHI